MKCCICEEEIPLVGTWAEGNNAEPVVDDGRCCNDCNSMFVIPARMNPLVLVHIQHVLKRRAGEIEA